MATAILLVVLIGSLAGRGRAALAASPARLRGPARARAELAAPARARHLPAAARRPRARHGLGLVRARRARLLVRLDARAVRAAAAAGRPAAQPGRHEGRPPRPGVQHRRLVRDQHELAVVLARAHHELPHADERPGRAELRLGRGRHVGGGRDGARLLPLREPRHRQLLGRHGARHALRAAPARARRRRRAARTRRRADVRRPGARPDALRRRRRRSPAARSPGRRRSRSSAPTAAARSTPTRRIPTRTRRRSRTCSRSGACS